MNTGNRWMLMLGVVLAQLWHGHPRRGPYGLARASQGRLGPALVGCPRAGRPWDAWPGRPCHVALMLGLILVWCGQLWAQTQAPPTVYIPYRDLGAVLDPSLRAVMLPRGEFDKLLALARVAQGDSGPLAQISQARYDVQVKGLQASITGTLTLTCLGDQPLAVPMPFERMGLTSIRLDGRDAPLGYDPKGRLMLVVRGKGSHEVLLSGSPMLEELEGGGTQLRLSVPPAVAGVLELRAAGDVGVQATVPVRSVNHDAPSDATTAQLAIGGAAAFTAVLTGNGRQEAQRTILLGSSASLVQLGLSDQILRCRYSVDIFGRPARELAFSLPAGWTVTDLQCPGLVKWSVQAADDGRQRLSVRLQQARAGRCVVAIEASAPRPAGAWEAPAVRLDDAASQSGTLLVDLGGELKIKSQSLSSAQFEDAALAAAPPGTDAPLASRAYYHWGADWRVGLDLAEAPLRRLADLRQDVTVSADQVALTASLTVTAIAHEMYDLSMDLPPRSQGWELLSVSVAGRTEGFQYVVDESSATARRLTIELPSPVRPDASVQVVVAMRQVPSDWLGQDAWAAPHRVSVPMVRPQADLGEAVLGVSGKDYLDLEAAAVPAGLRAVTVGRMSQLGLDPSVQLAWQGRELAVAPVVLEARRRQPRVIASSAGLVGLTPAQLSGDWLIRYAVTRAAARRLYLLADRSLGEGLRIDAPSRRIASRAIVKAGAATAEVAEALGKQYDLWEVTLDAQAIGPVDLTVHYDRARDPAQFRAPLIRPAGVDQAQEVLAVQVSQELSLQASPQGAQEMDAVDLPPLAGPADRIVWAYRLEPISTPAGQDAAVNLTATPQDSCAAPPALVRRADIDILIGPDGSQQGQATFQVVNAGLQMLPVRLPPGAQMWSVRVDDHPVKPKRNAAGDYLVACPRSRDGAVVRAIYWLAGPACLDRLDLAAATVPAVPVNQTRWSVTPPPGYRLWSASLDGRRARTWAPAPAAASIPEIMPSLRYEPRARELAYRMSPAHEVQMQVEERARVEAPPPASQPSAAKQFEYRLGALMAQGRYTLPVELTELTAPLGHKSFESLGQPAATVWLQSQRRAEGWWWLGLAAAVAVGLATLKRRGRTRTLLVVALLAGATLLAAWSARAAWLANGAFWGALILIGVYLVVAVGRIVFSRGASKIAPVAAACLLLCCAWTVSANAQTPPPSEASPWLLHRAAEGGHVGQITDLISKGQDPNSRDADGCAPLHLAARHGHRQVCQRLLAAGAQVNALSTRGWTPLDEAKAGGHTELTAYLQQRGAVSGASPAVQPPRTPADASASPAATQPAPPAPPRAQPIYVPYSGDATTATLADKVLVDYAQYVRLWNLAHPDQPLEAPPAGSTVTLAGSSYQVQVSPPNGDDPGRLDLVLTAQVVVDGDRPILLPLPVKGLAITSATLDGQPAAVQAAPSGQVLMLPARAKGLLRIEAVATPAYRGRSGQVTVSLPPLPAAGMRVMLASDDLTLEAVPPAGAVVRDPSDARAWLLSVDASGELTLRWFPRAGGGQADRTVQVLADHQVRVFHWGLSGASSLTYTFSSGQVDRLSVLLPPRYALTEATGDNVRDFSPVGSRQVDGEDWSVVEVRLHRPAASGCRIELHWLADLPALDKPASLPLPQAADVGRESGLVALFAAGGLSLRTVDVTGGRRADTAPTDAATLSPQSPVEVARYYWPYRPFAIRVEVRRQTPTIQARLRQLVRVAPDNVQLLADVELEAANGRLFSCSFALPDGYELLSVLGPAVADYYVQPTPLGRRLHVNLTGADRTRLALAMVRTGAPAGTLAAPHVTLIASDGAPLPQEGMQAVQVAAALEASTVASENLTPVPPSASQGWLEAPQAQAVQFAYTYDRPGISLSLDIKPRPSIVRANVLAAVRIDLSAVTYAYRLRYTIEGSPADQVRFSLPAELGPLVSVSCPAMRSSSSAPAQDGQVLWTVSLTDELTGEVDVMCTFSLPLDLQAGTLAVPRVAPDAPFTTDIAVQNISPHLLQIGQSSNLSPMPASRQRQLLSLQVQASLQYAFQAFEADWSLSLGVTPAARAARVQAVVDLMALRTAIDPTGRCRYQADLTLQNRSEQFLAVRIPAGLTLWSAFVDRQPVKPARSPGQDKDLVWIPLVKTSPGGLPYDVSLYLEGRLDGGLGLVSRVAPPAIRVEGVPVTRTTWSLLLPEGYHYRLAGGNVSPTAGTAELMSIASQARLDQLARMAGSAASLSSSRSQEVAGQNWEALNREVDQQITQTDQYIRQNRFAMGKAAYGKVSRQISDQRAAQARLVQEDLARRQAQQAGFTNSIVSVVTDQAGNAGLAESSRNSVLMAMPQFLQQAQEQQRQALAEELARQQAPQQPPQAPQIPTKVGQPVPREAQAGPQQDGALDLRGGRTDDKPADAKEQAMVGRARQQRATQVQQQLQDVASNRAQLFYSKGESPQAGPSNAPQRRSSGRPGKGGLPTGDRMAQSLAMEPQEEESAGAQVQSKVRRALPPAAPAFTAGGSAGGQEAQGGAMLASYASTAVYSLPVELPGGAVQLDFAHPGAQPSVVLWAVQTRLINALAATAATLVAAGLLWLLWRWGPRARGLHYRPGKMTVIVTVLAAVLAFLVAGPVGVAVVVVLVAILGLVHKLGRSRRAA